MITLERQENRKSILVHLDTVGYSGCFPAPPSPRNLKKTQEKQAQQQEQQQLLLLLHKLHQQVTSGVGIPRTEQ